MHARKSLLLTSALLFGILLFVGLWSQDSQAQESAAEPVSAIALDASLREALLAEGSADFVIVMADRPDLSGASSIKDWIERGRYVYEGLRDSSARSQEPVKAYLDQNGLVYRSFFSNNTIYVEDGDLPTAEAVARLPGVSRLRLPQVATIQPGIQLSIPPNKSFGWNLDVLDPTNDLFGMQAAQVWQQYGITGQNITVASIDTGVYFQHVALDRQYRGNLSGVIGGPYDHNYNWYQPNFKPCGSGTYPCDADGHGSGTVGIMVGETPNLSEQIGVAPDAQWIACQGCDDPPYCTEAALTGCADWMIAPCPIGADPGDPSCNPDLRPQIINNSWGGSGCNTWYQPFVQAWVAAGIFPAFAAGNAGGCGTVASPGDLPESFGTAAHFTNGANSYAGGPSCFFPTPTCEISAHDIDPHVNAPTGGWTSGSCQGCYYSLGGTSGASPHTAGAVALLWSANPGLMGQMDATFTALEQSANQDLPAPSCGKPACAGTNDYPNYDFGWGYLDALAAVELGGVADQGTLQGTVTEGTLPEDPGDPLPGVAITAKEADGPLSIDSLTGSSGVYTMTLAQGTYTVTADGPLHGPEVVGNVIVTTDTITTLDFQLIPKGELFGYVTDAGSGAPLAATVRTINTDPVNTDPDTGYYSIYLGYGNQNVIVEADNYASQTMLVQIVSGQSTEQDFSLVSALDVSPDPIEVTVSLFDSISVTTVLTNNTTSNYDFSLSHSAARAGDEGTILLVHGEVLDENPHAFEIALQNLYYDYLLVDDTTFYSTPITDLLSFAAVIYTGTPDAGSEHDHIIEYLDAGGRFLLSDGSFTLYHQDSRLHEIYLQAEYDGLWEWASTQDGLDIMAGLYPDISSAVVVYDSYAGPEGVGIFRVPGSNFSGIRTERAGYRSIFLSFDLNRIDARPPGDPPETDVVYRALLWLLGYPVESQWFGTNPVSGSVPANDSVSFSSQFNPTPANGVDQPGEFYAQLQVRPASGLETYPYMNVPVHMSVLPGPNMGRLVGTITSDRPGGPMETGVLIEAAGGESWLVTSDWWTGDYGYWLDSGSYTVTVAADGYYTETAVVGISPGLTTTLDFYMVMAAPEISISPLAIDENIPFGSTITQSLQVANIGPEPLQFLVEERDRGMTPLVESNVNQTLVNLDGARILFDELHGGNPIWYEDLFADLESLGATVDVISEGQITSTVLAGYDVLFIGDFLDVPYHFEEIDAIDSFVKNGGGLFVSYECCDDTTAPVITAMYDIVYIGKGGTGGVTNDVYPHPTTESVGAVYIPSPQYLMTTTVTGTAQIILYDIGGDPAAAVNEVGNGKVFVMPDQQLWDTVYGQADNTQLGRNIFTWLYGDVPWLSTDVLSGTLASGEVMTVAVGLDGSIVAEPGIYYGDLNIPNNDPLMPAWLVPVTLTVSPTAELGRLEGTVASNRPGGPLPASVLVENDSGGTLTLHTIPSTGEYARWLPVGTYTVTASATGYITETTSVSVVAQSTTIQDFELLLDAPGIATTPTQVSEIVTLGLTATRQITVNNIGLQNLDFSILEEDLEGNQQHESVLQNAKAYAFDFENDAFVSFYLDDPGNWTTITTWPYQHFEGGDFRLNDFSQIYVIWGSYLQTLNTSTGEIDFIDCICLGYPNELIGMTIGQDGTIYVVSYDLLSSPYESSLWTVDPDHATPTLVGQITNAELVTDIAINLDGEMYGVDAEQDVLIQIDSATAAGSVVGSLGFDLWLGSLDYNDDSGVLYMGDWDYLSNQGHLWTMDTGSGTPTAVGDFPSGSGIGFLTIAADGLVDVPWLEVNPIAGTVAPGSDLVVDLAFDTTVVSGPDLYLANLHFGSNDPLLSDLTVPVSMTVAPSQDYGQIEGTVTSIGYCDAAPTPLAAQLLIASGTGETWEVSSDPTNGYYTQWVPSGPYTVTAAAESHIPLTTTVVVSAGGSTTQDFDLRLFEPCLSLAPETISITLSSDSVYTTTLEIGNSGARELIWSMRETTDTIALPPIPPFAGTLPASTEPTTIMPLNRQVQAEPIDDGAFLSMLLGEPAYGLDTSSFNLVHIPDTTDPGTWNVLANVGRFYSGADFWHGDFSKMYAIDFDTNELVTLDLASGMRTLIGVATPHPGHRWTGLTAATDGTLYGVATECNVDSGLYTIDRQTAEATLIGLTTSATCLIDVAINAQGEMYAVDIADDILVQIDPTTGAATSIGLLGINANHAQAMDFEEETGVLYWAAVDYAGHLRRIDTNTGNSLAIGDFPGYVGVDSFAMATGGGDPFWGDVPWLTEVPTTGVTMEDSTTEVSVTINTTDLVEDECYEAGLGLIHDDPQYEEPAIVPVSLCVRSAWPVFLLEKTVEAADMHAGDIATYTLSFGNDGSLETGVTISDVLPYGVEYAWSDPAGNYDTGRHEVVWSNLTLDNGSRFTHTIVVTVSHEMEPGSVLTNTSYLMWRDQVMMSDWASFTMAPGIEIFLPLVAHSPVTTVVRPLPVDLPAVLSLFWKGAW